MIEIVNYLDEKGYLIRENFYLKKNKIIFN